MNSGAVRFRFLLLATLFLALAACERAIAPVSPAAVVSSTAVPGEPTPRLPAAAAPSATPTIPADTHEPTATPAASATPTASPTATATASPTALPAALAQIRELEVASCSTLGTIDTLTIDEVWDDIVPAFNELANGMQFQAIYFYEADGAYAPGQLAMQVNGRYTGLKPEPEFSIAAPLSLNYAQSETKVVDLLTGQESETIIVDDKTWVKLTADGGWIEQAIPVDAAYYEPVFNLPEGLGPARLMTLIQSDTLTIGRVEQLQLAGQTVTHRCWQTDPELEEKPVLYVPFWDGLFTFLEEPEVHFWLDEEGAELQRVILTGRHVADRYYDYGVEEHDPPNNFYYAVEVAAFDSTMPIEAPEAERVVLSIPAPALFEENDLNLETWQFPLPDGAVKISDPRDEVYEEGDLSGLKPREFTWDDHGSDYFWMSSHLRAYWVEMPYALRPVYESESDLPALFAYYTATLRAQGWQLDSVFFRFGLETYFLLFRNGEKTLPLVLDKGWDGPATINVFLPRDEANELLWTGYRRYEDSFLPTLLVDRRDRVWLAGTDGITVYDETSWSRHLPERQVRGIALDPQGNVWVTTAVGVEVYDGSAWSIPPHVDDVSFGEYGLGRSTVDLSGQLWTEIKIDQQKIGRFDGAEWRFYAGDALVNCDISVFFADSEGRLWLGKESVNDLFFFDGTVWYQVIGDEHMPVEVSECSGDDCLGFEAGSCSGTFDEGINNIVEDSEGDIWVGTTTGLRWYDGRTWTTYDVESDNLPFVEIQAMSIDPYDRLWIVSKAGALHMRDVDGSWQSYFPQSEMVRLDYVEDMTADSQGNIWLAGGLLYKLEPPAP